MVVVIFSVVVVIIVVLTLIINIILVSMWWASWILQLQWLVVNSCRDCLTQSPISLHLTRCRTYNLDKREGEITERGRENTKESE